MTFLQILLGNSANTAGVLIDGSAMIPDQNRGDTNIAYLLDGGVSLFFPQLIRTVAEDSGTTLSDDFGNTVSEDFQIPGVP